MAQTVTLLKCIFPCSVKRLSYICFLNIISYTTLVPLVPMKPDSLILSQVILQCNPDFYAALSIDNSKPLTALHRTILCKSTIQIQLVEMLWEAGIDVNRSDPNMDDSPLFLAFRKRNHALIKLLVRYGADVLHKEIGQIYMYAFSCRKVDRCVLDLWDAAWRSKVKQNLSDDHPEWQFHIKVSINTDWTKPYHRVTITRSIPQALKQSI